VREWEGFRGRVKREGRRSGRAKVR